MYKSFLSYYKSVFIMYKLVLYMYKIAFTCNKEFVLTAETVSDYKISLLNIR